MKTFFVWCVLFTVCWPIAVVALVLYPLIWMVLLPFRLVGMAVDGVLALVAAIIRVPARAVRRLA